MADATTLPLCNGPPTTPAQPAPIELALPLPHAPNTTLHLHLTLLATSTLLFLTTADASSSTAPAAMGSFVYAMPNRSNLTAEPLSTALYPVPSTVDFATRVAKVLARKTGKPAYVGAAVSFAMSGMGGSVAEEVEAFRAVVEAVMAEWEKYEKGV